MSPPSSVDIAGTNFEVSDPASGAPFAFAVSGLAFSGTDLSIRLNHRTPWVMLSEVRFEGDAAVPEPDTLALAAEVRQLRPRFRPVGQS